ncbi:MAG: ribonuclease Z [Bacteroidetes bacterium]|nr:ribonuclease Z [Bacteroidota bacterium]
MKPFSVTILGCGSATPSKTRNPSAQIVNIHDRLMMIDCGEGSQMQMRRFYIKNNRINHIFISHLHGDHYLGLMGLLFTYHLFGRTEEMHIYAPQELKDVIDLQLKVSNSQLLYPLIFHPITSNTKTLLLENNTFKVFSFPVQHSVNCWGFVFEEKNCGYKINKEFITQEKPTIEEIQSIKQGADFINSQGVVFENSDIVLPADLLRSYAYSSDTIYDENIIPFIENTSLLYHEATFMHDKADVAKQKFHTTAKEAATIAYKAKAKKLIIGHFSARYDDNLALLAEAREYFPNTIAAEDGLKVEINVEL